MFCVRLRNVIFKLTGGAALFRQISKATLCSQEAVECFTANVVKHCTLDAMQWHDCGIIKLKSTHQSLLDCYAITQDVRARPLSVPLCVGFVNIFILEARKEFYFYRPFSLHIIATISEMVCLHVFFNSSIMKTREKANISSNSLAHQLQLTPKANPNSLNMSLTKDVN